MKVQKMNKEKDTLVPMSKNQLSPGLCDPRDFDVIEAGAALNIRTPFHNQCGSTEAEYRKLLREGDVAANASDRVDEPELHPNVNRAGKPHTP